MSLRTSYLPRPTLYSVIAPAGVIRPILRTPASVNQTLPSGPAVIALGLRSEASLNSATEPVAGLRRAIRCLLPCTVNQREAFGPAVTCCGSRPATKPGTLPARYSVITPLTVMVPTASFAVNHRLPSGPAVMSAGALSCGRFALNSVTPAEAAVGHARSATAVASSGRRRRVRIRGTGLVSAAR